ncbi:hypothetical protein MYCTH_2294115 [Thermothelomyces thermophilus ATCC 42464]|uniref:Endosomal/vacuolar adapter protein YPT35 n=1 Tax=Thermothelomyces thermophilus (strain ATCC 42464 / BCRC 31852 / DSM 1799) TaxID=573729 RepID=G2PZT1_THET4|nr:uncharacterized protein MYCTH_2294115 [Thermothelomyces thermophilus ATCC 42464]AEO53156.1 hypothetical protein MYCTH_2294115 [Thermothelomyces thermophilus ATCC 42464]
MASEHESEQHPQQSVQRAHPPEPSPNGGGSGSGSAARDGDEEPAKQTPPEQTPPEDGIAQPVASTSHERGCGPDPDPDPESNRAPLFPEDGDGGNDAASDVSIPSDDAASHEVVSPSASIPPYWTNPRLLERQQQKQQQQNGQQPRPHTATASSSSSSSSSGRLLGQHGHARTVSSASAESVLPPGAITLQDNEREEEGGGEGVNGSGGAVGNGRASVGPAGAVAGGGRRSNGGDRHGRERNRACWARSVQVTDYVLVNGSTTNIGAFVVWIIKVETLNGSRMNIRKRYSEFDDLRRRLVQTFPGFEAAVPALPPKSVLKRFHPRFLEKRRAGLQYFLNCILLNPEFSGSPVLKDFLFS